MTLQSRLYHGSITHLKCHYGLATRMSVTLATSDLGQHVAWSYLSDRGYEFPASLTHSPNFTKSASQQDGIHEDIEIACLFIT